MPKISVIIPAYNVEKYLRKCIDSVINQTLSDIEIICIDDGSSDESIKILDEYSKSGKIILIKQQNQGSGAARNKGISVSNGEYLYFLDSDDYLMPEALEKAYKKIMAADAEICVFKNYRYKENNKTFEPCHWEHCVKLIPNKKIFNKYDLIDNFFQFCNITPWTKLYNKNFLLENNIKFQNVKSCNDVYFNYVSLSCANSITFLNEMLVVHRIEHNECITKNRGKHVECILKAFEELKSELENRNLFTELEKTFYKRAHYCFLYELTFLDNLFVKFYWQTRFYTFLPNKYFIKDFVKGFFSLTNKDIYKVISILWIEFKFRSKKLIKKKEKFIQVNLKDQFENLQNSLDEK